MKEAIQKAIEGGWRPQDYGFTKGDTKLEGFYLEDQKIIINASKEYLRDGGRYYQLRDGGFWIHITQATSDPLFWQALGKALGWKYPDSRNRGRLNGEWMDHWEDFIHHLTEGKDAESFFKELLK